MVGTVVEDYTVVKDYTVVGSGVDIDFGTCLREDETFVDFVAPVGFIVCCSYFQ